MQSRAVANLVTPCFLVDRAKVEANCNKMLALCRQLNVQLRAQTKTHKTIEGAVLQTGGSKRCVVVSTLDEAEFYARAGFDDILYGYPLTPDKIPRCQQLTTQLQLFHVMLDNTVILQALQANPPCVDKQWSVFLKIDCGNKRAGVWYEKFDDVLELAQQITRGPNTRFAGIYVHCGNSYSAQQQGVGDPRSVGSESATRAANIVRRLEAAGVHCPTFGIGSTPSCSHPSAEMAQLTELHPGNYVFYDAQQFSLGSCSLDEIACRVATRIIGHYPHRQQMLIDAGFLATTKQGLGQLPTGCAIFQDHPDLKLVDMTQEIGKVESVTGKLNFEQYPIGSMLFFYPWHSCATAAMHGRYHIVDEQDMVVDEWVPTRGW